MNQPSPRELPKPVSGGTGQPDLMRAAPARLRRVQPHDADHLAGNPDGVAVDYLCALLRDSGEGKQDGGEVDGTQHRAKDAWHEADCRVLPLFLDTRYAAAMLRRRVLSTATADAAMAAAQEMRRAALKVRTEAPIGAPAYEAAGAVLEWLDAMAEALTGRRNALHDTAHRAGG
jgi:hypothetical protein